MPPKKDAPKVDVFVEVVIILVTILFIWLVWVRLEAYLEYIGVGSFGSLWNALMALIYELYPFVIVLCVFLTAGAIYGIWYNLKKIRAITAEEDQVFNPNPALAAAVVVQEKNPRWDKIVIQSNSLTPSDWSLAIIDADSMLADLLQAQGYQGDGVGEKLKAVEKSDFLTLDLAWDAHKVRNQIAHPTPDFDLTSRETQRVISEFESVFQEFKII